MIKQLNKYMRAAFLSMLVAAFGVVSTGAYALTNTTSVVNSGDDAEVETEVESETSVWVNNTNTAVINQAVTSSANTGHNEANGNIGDTSIRTGSATTSVEADAEANSSTTMLELGSLWGGSNMTDVVNTGDDAEVDTEVELETRIGVMNNNFAEINQAAETHSNTGYNEANGNIGDVDLDTGNASTGVELDASANENMTVIGGLNGENGLDNETIVTNTGDDAEVDTEVESETSIWVRNSNEMTAMQSLFGTSNSGHNEANSNIGDTEVMTGSALLLSRLGVSGNTNATGIGGSVLSPDSESMADIVNTGDDLESESETEIEMKVKVGNNNSLFGSQWFNVSSDSGYSETNGNIGDSSVWSGASGTGADVSVGGNTNMTVMGMLGSLLNLLAL